MWLEFYTQKYAYTHIHIQTARKTLRIRQIRLSVLQQNIKEATNKSLLHPECFFFCDFSFLRKPVLRIHALCFLLIKLEPIS